MFRMCVVLLIFSSIYTVVVGALVTVTGHTGERFNISCTYESGYESNSKYLCKGDCNIVNKVIMVKSGSPAEDQRFSLSDDRTARVFTVTITDLRLEDEGQYWCGVKRTGTDVYSEIVLLVKQVGGGAPVIVTGYRGERFNIRCTYESGYESNPKYLCKGECKVIVVKSGSPAEDERFSLTDNKTARVFTVSITDLRLADEGQYWCGVERSLSADVYSEIVLLVKQEPSYFSTTETNPQSSSITVSDQNKSTDAVSEIYICVED
ncbi:CMRF35-like molecule 1 [Cyprinus carpio]|uniref:CMRF35-like molecule 1 n=1 Tax=Cyprinus carpio TaxID=7962 RepID=A0A9Q9YIS5_CYPCA|nr:CMRF35-like molecule 1 [Cyprinus carpio]